jgi:lipopolysaccharide/colanic/teichoic acid biosynthesis glycosyltransferase
MKIIKAPERFPARLAENDLVMTLSGPTRSARSPQLIAKRVFDIFGSIAMLAGLLPLFLLVALAVRLDSRGPIFAVSRKYCYNNQTVHVLSFRCSETFIGRSLVRSGLDRLPMLINVLRGEMSTVGPHYHIGPPSVLSDRLSLALRNSAFRPGLVNFEGEQGRADSELRLIEADLFYVLNWSLLLDAKILFQKFFSKASYVQNYLHH